jgi:hypothetical protein
MIMKTNGLNKYPFLVQVICLPITWLIAILKILVVIPIWITAKCNEVIKNIE